MIKTKPEALKKFWLAAIYLYHPLLCSLLLVPGYVHPLL